MLSNSFFTKYQISSYSGLEEMHTGNTIVTALLFRATRHMQQLPVHGWPQSACWPCPNGTLVKETNGQDDNFSFEI